MKTFRTVFPPFKSTVEINYSSKIISFGSCFAENIGTTLKQLKLQVASNPFGISYNPLSIANSIEMIYNNHQFNERDIVFDKGLWHSHWHHSRFSKKDKMTLLSEIQKELSTSRAQLLHADTMIFTFGTAYYYTHIETNFNVNNCHKIPADQFEKKRLSVESIVDRFKTLLSTILETNPNMKLIFTVSPIRHIKDGFMENTRSKSILHLAIEKLVLHFEQAHYFPSYEIIMDDLRSYQFYSKDLVHPNNTAIDYVWNYFSEAFFNSTTQVLIDEITQIKTATMHRPFHQSSAAHKTFIRKTLEKISRLKNKMPTIDFTEEESILTNQLNA